MDTLMRSLSKLRIFQSKWPGIVRPGIQYCTATNSAPENQDNSEIIIQNISNGDKSIENQLRVLMLELDVMRHEGLRVPDEHYIKQKHWEELLTFKSKSGRMKYIGYLFKNSKAEENRKMKKEASRLEYEKILQQRKEEPIQSEDNIEYNLSGNSMFLRIYETSMNLLYNRKLMQATMYGQKLIMDCSYDKDMTKKENQNAAKQIMLLFADNRMHMNPFDLYFCNCDQSGTMMQALHRYIPTMYEDDFPMNVHSESYMDLFPQDRLVYLTPHCRNDLEYNPDDIYIIGCMVDKATSEPLSAARAKKNRIRMARLPLDRHLEWGTSSTKSLTLNQMVNIMLDMNLTQDWKHALRHVPRRKLMNDAPRISNYNPSAPQANKSAFAGFKRRPDKRFNIDSYNERMTKIYTPKDYVRKNNSNFQRSEFSQNRDFNQNRNDGDFHYDQRTKKKSNVSIKSLYED